MAVARMQPWLQMTDDTGAAHAPHLSAPSACTLPLASWFPRLAREKTCAVNTSGLPPSSTYRSSSEGTSTASASRCAARPPSSLTRPLL